MSAPVRHPTFCFDNTLVAIQIENVLFNVHKYQLIKSETFADMFGIAEQSKTEGKPAEGSSLENPIKMDEVSASDFECLLTVLYATHFSAHQPEPKASLIIPAFRLANMWNFSDLSAYLLPLAEKELGDIDKIAFAREFDIKDWLAPAHINLCRRAAPLTIEEATKLGVSSLLMISLVREEFPPNPSSNRAQTCTPTMVYCENCANRPVPVIHHSRFYFDDTLVIIQIENVQFRVHKYQLVKSETFADMFAIAEQGKEEGKAVEGSSDENPIKLEGVSASDFESLLSVLYTGHFSNNQPEPESSLIIPAFRLANMWNFADLRACLMPLAERVLGDADKIVFAREFGLGSWITPAYTRLCQRKEPLNTEEAAKIGLDGVLLISRIREGWFTNAGGASIYACCNNPVGCAMCGGSGIMETVNIPDTHIGEQLDAWTKNGQVFTKNA